MLDKVGVGADQYLAGAADAFVAKLDEERQTFNFKRVLLINPPVSIYNSISLLDRMTNNIPGGVDNFNKFVDDAAKADPIKAEVDTDPPMPVMTFVAPRGLARQSIAFVNPSGTGAAGMAFDIRASVIDA